MDMNQKMYVYFNQVLPTRMENPDWKIIGTEIAFEFVYDNQCIIHGFIDRVKHFLILILETYWKRILAKGVKVDAITS